jgi:hypothetical protein
MTGEVILGSIDDRAISGIPVTFLFSHSTGESSKVIGFWTEAPKDVLSVTFQQTICDEVEANETAGVNEKSTNVKGYARR